MRAHEFVTEAFDQPYPMTWEHGDDSHDALAKLSNGTNLSIMFNKDYGDYGDEEWTVEFWRNNSQEVTGEGDQQRVFATVLSAIQQFIDTEHPARIRFSANKDVDPGQKSQTRSNLYTKLVQRYANSWGYSVDVDDFSDTTVYNLYTLHESVTENFAEGREEFNQEIMQPGFEFSQEINGVTYKVVNDLGQLMVTAWGPARKKIGHAVFWKHQTRSGLESLSTEVDPDWQGKGIAANMYAVVRMLGANINPSLFQTRQGKHMWNKWRQQGDVAQLKNMNAKIKEQAVDENFADGKVKGKSRPGRVKRAGASCAGSVTDLRQRAKNASGEKAKMYHWCANMKSGRKK